MGHRDARHAAAELALAADLARMRNDVHSCGPTCSNAGCVAARQARA
jgi:hypothetical protein